MHVTELSREQLVELKQSYLTQLDDEGLLEEVTELDALSWGALAEADNIVPDDVVFDNYSGVCFTNDDFFCTAGI